MKVGSRNGSSAGLMAMLVAMSVVSITWMTVIAMTGDADQARLL